jgi:hypothetical protein
MDRVKSFEDEITTKINMWLKLDAHISILTRREPWRLDAIRRVLRSFGFSDRGSEMAGPGAVFFRRTGVIKSMHDYMQLLPLRGTKIGLVVEANEVYDTAIRSYLDHTYFIGHRLLLITMADRWICYKMPAERCTAEHFRLYATTYVLL